MFPTQGQNPHLVHWQADSLPLSQQGSPSFFQYILVWLHQVFVAACRILSCSTWDLVPWPEIKPGPPALGVQSLSHRITGETPLSHISDLVLNMQRQIRLHSCPLRTTPPVYAPWITLTIKIQHDTNNSKDRYRVMWEHRPRVSGYTPEKK